MRLLLTSAGLTNKKIVDALIELVGKAPGETNIAFVPTAANIEQGEKGWLIDDLSRIKAAGFIVDIVDISALEKDMWLQRFGKSHVLFFGGGNTFHLKYWINKSGLDEILPELLEKRVYAGISAGSCVAGPTIYNSVQNLFGESYKLKIEKGLGLVDFQFVPHLNSKWFEKIREENLRKVATEIKDSIYAMDDQSAVKIDNYLIEIVSEGKHLQLNV